MITKTLKINNIKLKRNFNGIIFRNPLWATKQTLNLLKIRLRVFLLRQICAKFAPNLPQRITKSLADVKSLL